MQFTMTVEIEGAAFEDFGVPSELGRMLSIVSDRIREQYVGGDVLDTNGNHRGTWKISDA